MLIKNLCVVLFLAVTLNLAYASEFSPPPLNGRVVDQAGILPPTIKNHIEQKLETHEKETTHQAVVAIVSSLNGLTIEDYANQLYNAWALGQKNQNNGVLFLVALQDRQVRFEIGYGLEGILPDASAHRLIQEIVIPAFKKGQIAEGIQNGVDALVTRLSSPPPSPVEKKESSTTWQIIFVLLVMGSIYGLVRFIIGFCRFWKKMETRYGGPSHSTTSTTKKSSFSSKPSRASSFRGRGGKSGGGGASGRW